MTRTTAPQSARRAGWDTDDNGRPVPPWREDSTDLGVSREPDPQPTPAALTAGRLDPGYRRSPNPNAARRWLPEVRAILARVPRRSA